MACVYKYKGKTYSEQEFKKHLLSDKAASRHIGFPLLPFAQNWHELAMKRILRYGAERGYDRVGWVTGDQTAERYDLSKHIDTIRYAEDGGKYQLYATKGGHEVLGLDSIAPEKLADYVGKDVAEKIIKDKGRSPLTALPAEYKVVEKTGRAGDKFVIQDSEGNYYAGSNTREQAVTNALNKLNGGLVADVNPEMKLLSGLDLKVGGEWAKALYDRAIPNFMRKYAGKWGAKVGETKIPAGQDSGRLAELNRTQQARNQFTNISPEDIQKTTSVHSVDITPAMKESVLGEGQPLFSQTVAGSGLRNSLGELRRLPNGKHVLWLGDQQMEALQKTIWPGNASKVHGVVLSARDLNEIVRRVGTLVPPNSGLIYLLNTAQKVSGGQPVPIVGTTGEGLNFAVKVAREELVHGWQKAFEGGNHLTEDAENRLYNQIPMSIMRELDNSGYGSLEYPRGKKSLYVLEATAKLSAGDFPKLPDDVREKFLTEYFKEIEAQHGPKAFETLTNTKGVAKRLLETFRGGMEKPNERIPETGIGIAAGGAEHAGGLFSLQNRETEGIPRTAEEEARLRELIAQQNIRSKYTPKETQQLLDSLDPRKLTDEHRRMSREVGNHFDETLEKAMAAKALNHGVADYVTRLWQNPENESVRRVVGQAHNGAFSVNTSMARHRIFQSTLEGLLLGEKLSDHDLVSLAAHNGNTFGRIIAARKLLERLQDHGTRASDGMPMVALSGRGDTIESDKEGKPVDPFVVVNPKGIRNVRIADKIVDGFKASGDFDRLVREGKLVKFGEEQNGKQHYAWGTAGYKVVDHPAFHNWIFASGDTVGRPVYVKGELRVHPEAFDYLKKRLGLEKSALAASGIGKVLSKAGQEAKGVLLFGSPFHVIQEGLRAVMTGISPFGIERFNPEDKAHLLAAAKGVMADRDYRDIEAFQEGRMSGHSQVLKKIPGLAQTQDWLQNFLFEKYIPGLKLRSFRKLLAEYRRAYPEWTEDKVGDVAASDTNERFGGIDYKKMGRSVATQDLFRLVALAPDWLESEIRFMARSFGDEGRVSRRDVARMALGLWAAARVVNYLSTGNAHYEAPFGMATKDKDGKEKIYSVRTLPTDILHAVSDPGGFLAGRVSPLLKGSYEAYSGRDPETGHKVPTHNIAFDIAKSAAPIWMQSVGKTLSGETPDLGNTDQVVKAAGGAVNVYKSPAQTLASQMASDHSEMGAVPESALRHHQTLIRFEDELRRGEMQPQQIYQLVDTGQVAPKDAKAIMKNVEETKGMDSALARLYSRAARLQAPEFLKVWDAANNNEKSSLGRLLIKKRIQYFKKAMTEMTPQQRMQDETYRRLRELFPAEQPF